MDARCTRIKLLRWVLALCPFPELCSSAPLERYACACLCHPVWKVRGSGAGLYIDGGTATLTDTNVYSNVAGVSEPAYLSSSAPLN